MGRRSTFRIWDRRGFQGQQVAFRRGGLKGAHHLKEEGSTLLICAGERDEVEVGGDGVSGGGREIVGS